MSSQDKKIPKKRGRPATGLGLQINVRLHDAELELVDRFRFTEPDQPSRPEAIRRLIGRVIATLSLERLSGPADEQQAKEHTAPAKAASTTDRRRGRT